MQTRGSKVRNRKVRLPSALVGGCCWEQEAVPGSLPSQGVLVPGPGEAVWDLPEAPPQPGGLQPSRLEVQALRSGAKAQQRPFSVQNCQHFCHLRSRCEGLQRRAAAEFGLSPTLGHASRTFRDVCQQLDPLLAKQDGKKKPVTASSLQKTSTCKLNVKKSPL